MADFLPDWVPTVTHSPAHISPSSTLASPSHTLLYIPQQQQRPLTVVREESLIRHSSAADREDDPENYQRASSQQEPKWKGPYQDLSIFLPDKSRVAPFTLILILFLITAAGDVGIVWAVQEQWAQSNPNYKPWIFAFVIWSVLVVWQLLSLAWYTLLWARYWSERRPLVLRSYLRTHLHIWTILFGTQEQRAALRYFRRNQSHKLAEYSTWWLQGWPLAITQIFRSCIAVALLLLPLGSAPRGAKVSLLYINISLSSLIILVSLAAAIWYSLVADNEVMKHSVSERIGIAWDVADRPMLTAEQNGQDLATNAKMTKRAFVKEKISKLSLKIVKSKKDLIENSQGHFQYEKDEHLSANSSPNTPATATSTPSPARQSYMTIPKPDSPFAFSAGSISSLGTEISVRGIRSIFYRAPNSPGPNTLQLSQTPSPSYLPNNQESSGTSGTMTSVGELLPQSLRLFQFQTAESLTTSPPKPIFPVSPLSVSAALNSEGLQRRSNSLEDVPASPASKLPHFPVSEFKESQSRFSSLSTGSLNTDHNIISKHQVRSRSNLSKSSIIFEQPSSIHSAPTPTLQSFSSTISSKPKVVRRRRHTGPHLEYPLHKRRIRSGSDSHTVTELSNAAKEIWTISTKSLRNVMASHDYMEVPVRIVPESASKPEISKLP